MPMLSTDPLHCDGFVFLHAKTAPERGFQNDLRTDTLVFLQFLPLAF